MLNITDRTVIPLGVNLVAAASASFQSSSDLSGSATATVGGAAALSATGVTLTTSTAVNTAFRIASVPDLDAGLIALSDAGAFRISSASLAASVSLAASGIATFRNQSASPMGLSVVLTAAGGKQFNDSTAALSSELVVSIQPPGRLFIGGLVIMPLSVNMSTSVSPVYRLVLPVRKTSFTDDRLWRRFPVDVGVALLIKDGQGRLLEYPSDTELKDADLYYLGGYRHQITPAERAAIVAVGYGDLVEEA